MKKKTRILLITVASTIAAIILLLGATALLLNTHYVQQKLLHYATALLTERLNTRVDASSVYINILDTSLKLKGVCIDDQKGLPLLRINQLKAEMSLESLQERILAIEEVEVEGLETRLVKTDEDSVTNYQFLIDAFSKKKQPKEQTDSTEKKQGRWKVTFQPHHLKLTDIHVTHQSGKKTVQAEMQQLDVSRKDEAYNFDLANLHLTTSNGRPHRHLRRPKGGFFDAGNLNLMVAAQGTLYPVDKDSLNITLTNATIQDSVAGINICDLHLNATTNRETLVVTEMGLKQGSTTLNIERADITLPNKKTGRELAYNSNSISGHVVLHDIAKPLVPALKEFHLPLQLNTEMSGTKEEMSFRNVRVNTDDNRLKIVANGHFDNLHDGKNIIVGFDVERLHAKQGMAEKVINQFIVKKLMMNQLRRLGDIRYRGHFDVVRKSETFKGRLTTNGGDLDFRFTIDGNKQRVRGYFSSKAIKVGDVMEMPRIGDVNCQASFDIDISKQRTAQIRRKKGGKLPIGSATATVNDCSYRNIHVKNVDIDIKCDGAEAMGTVVQQGKHRQIHCNFIYSENDPKHKLRIKDAGISFRKKKKDKKSRSEE